MEGIGITRPKETYVRATIIRNPDTISPGTMNLENIRFLKKIDNSNYNAYITDSEIVSGLFLTDKYTHLDIEVTTKTIRGAIIILIINSFLFFLLLGFLYLLISVIIKAKLIKPIII